VLGVAATRCRRLQVHKVVLCGCSSCCGCCLLLHGGRARPGTRGSRQLRPLAETHHRHCCCWQVLQQCGLLVEALLPLVRLVCQHRLLLLPPLGLRLLLREACCGAWSR
jgi:hypothetical protein